MNLTVNEVLLNAGVLAVSLLKKDTGSGIKEVDLYRVMPGNLLFILYLILSLQQECRVMPGNLLFILYLILSVQQECS